MLLMWHIQHFHNCFQDHVRYYSANVTDIILCNFLYIYVLQIAWWWRHYKAEVQLCLKQNSPITAMESFRSVQESEASRFQDSRHLKVLSVSAFRICRLYQRKCFWYTFLGGLGSNPCADEVFCPSRPALISTQPPVKWVLGLTRG